jgi:hypothetical protein
LAKRDRLTAFGGGASDSIPFGLGDKVVAGTRAALGDAKSGGFWQRYDAQMQRERAQDDFDQKQFPVSRDAGVVAGTGAQILALGPLDGALGVGARIAEAMPMAAREYAALGAAGGALGLGGQAANDAAAGHLSSAGDYAGATIGGAASTVLAPYVGPGRATASGQWLTSVAQDALNGRPVSLTNAGQSVLPAGLVAGGLGKITKDAVGRQASNSKGDIGEAASQLRTIARGDLTRMTKGPRLYVPSGRYTVPDSWTWGGEIVESKLGPTAALRRAQPEAYGTNRSYRVDHWLPRDIASLVSVPIGILGGAFLDRRDRPEK